VTAQQATAGKWTETTPAGTYTATYTAKTAGDNLKANLTLNGVTPPTPVTYAITAGKAVKATLQADKATYEAGSPILLTVTLKDAQDNLVPGQVDKLTATTVTAQQATAGKWTETTPAGTYTATYTANKAGGNLKANLTLGSVKAETLTPYAITAGKAVTATSEIKVGGDSFVSGSDMVVTVTLKDAQGNLVSGHAELLDAGVAVPNASRKVGVLWVETGVGTGVYTATYVAAKVSTNQTATLRLGSSSIASNAYTITAGAPAWESSVIAVDGERYLLGGVLTVTVTLKDAANNPVTGQQEKLTAGVNVGNATLKDTWSSKEDGTYSATYTTNSVGDKLKATLTLSGWSQARESGVYRIVLGSIAGIQVNGHRFSADAGFPTMGFNKAKFTLELKEGKASDYTWSSSAPWVVVNDNGEVSFTGQGTGQRVTLTGTAKNGGSAIGYSFQLKHWFTNKGSQTMTWSEADMSCTLPTISQLSNGYSHIQTRAIGSLWSEWGDLTQYDDSGFASKSNYWALEERISGNHHVVLLSTGEVSSSGEGTPQYVACRQGF
jgi:adhesin/invasin